MKKPIAISLLFVFLCANTELHQLLKLPVLVKHYFEHLKQEPTESFAEYISEHYFTHLDFSDNDHHDHDNLPFKTTDCATMHTTVAFNHQQNFSFCEPHIVSEKVSAAYNVVIYSSAFLNNIWQPPQFS